MSNTITKLTYYLRFPILSALAGLALYYFTVRRNIDVSKCVSFNYAQPDVSIDLDMDCIHQTILRHLLINTPALGAGVLIGATVLVMMAKELRQFAVEKKKVVSEWCYSKFFATPTRISSTNNNSDDELNSLLLRIENPDDYDERNAPQILNP